MSVAREAWLLEDSGCDWITATSKSTSAYDPLYLAGKVSLEQEEARGEKVWRSDFLGYVGWASKHVQYGLAGHGVLCRMSGELAHDRWQDVLPLAQGVSRIDWQVTASPPAPDVDVAARARDGLRVAPATGPRRAQWSYTEWSKGGGMLTIGHRVSALYGRLYDKGVESGREAAGCLWRWEVECKGPAVGSGVAAVVASSRLDAAVAGGVHAYFAARGAEPQWQPDSACVHLYAAKRPSDPERTLAWLRTQVAPAVRRLSNARRGDDVRAALGL